MQLGFHELIRIAMVLGFFALAIGLVVFLRDFTRMHTRLRMLPLNARVFVDTTCKPGRRVKCHKSPSGMNAWTLSVCGLRSVLPGREAEVYLAAGHKEMAIQILEQAAQESPTPDNIRRRLLEPKRVN